jgi:hypothetical protein
MGNAYNNASLLVTPNGYKASKIYSAKPTDGTGDLAFSRASTAMRRNSAGLWEEVANNVPRLQYPVGGGCPSWLFEPQATNLLTLSNTFTGGTWGVIGVTLVGGQTDSPAVASTSTLFYPTVTANDRRIQATFTAVNGQAYTTSIRVKAAGKNWIAFTDVNLGNIVWFDVGSGTLGTVGAGITASITLDSEGYYLCSFTSTATSILGRFYMLIVDGNGTLDITANGTDGVLIWNGQIELGSVATSPIITAGSAVTRLSDVASKTGISSLIGQTEGTLYIDLIGTYDRQTTSKTAVALTGGAANVRLDFYAGSFNLIALGIDVGAAFTSGQQYKVALVYANTSLKWFINGALYNSYTVTPSTFSAISLGSIASVNQPNTTIKDCILYTTALTDSEAIELTTI